MMTDVWILMWKERKSLLQMNGGGRKGIVAVLFPIFLLGGMGAFQGGPDFVNSWMLVGYPCFSSLYLSPFVADSFAGEKERHTLETLLATRMSDRAILFGKMGAAVAYGWGNALAIFGIGLLMTNLLYGHGKLLLCSPVRALDAVGLSLLANALAASGGVLISLNSATVREASQKMVVPMMLTLFAPLFLIVLPADWRKAFYRAVTTTDPQSIVWLLSGFLMIGISTLMVVAISRFRRNRLILD